MRHRIIAGATLALFFSSALSAAKPPDTIEGLFRIKAKQLEAVYLLPDADFRTYSKVMIDTPQVAFKKNWQRDYNSTTVGMGSRLDDGDVRRIIDEASAGFQDILAKEFTKGGYQVVTAPGPDVMRMSTAVINLSIVAPDTMSAGRSATFSRDAGESTLFLEVRDSLSGTLLGRAIDKQIVGDSTAFRRDSLSNRADFERLFDGWAKAGAKGLTALKAYSPVDANGVLRR
jgi:hypothetical protein